MYGIDERSLIKNRGKITPEQQLKNYNELKERNIDLPFNIDMVDPYCHACVLNQLKKYEKFVSETGKSYSDKFVVPCEGISTSDIFGDELKNGLTEELWEELIAQTDIVKWARKYLENSPGEPWVARWYQETVLRCNSRRKALRISRRSGKTTLVCIEICYHLFTKPGLRIIVAGPQKAQTEEIINRVKELINSNSELSSCVSRCVAAPYYKIELTNGSELRGFAAGDDGKAIRGQDADFLYLEEMQFIASEAITGAILPTLQTHPDTYLIGFSTPNSMVTPFFNMCTKSPDTKEFHFTYRVLPHKQQVEKDRDNYTEEKWDNEFEANFGMSSSGVYKKKDVDSARIKKKYEDYKPTQGWKYILGTDWNEKYGAEIYITGWSPFDKKFHGVHSEHVEPTQFTQLSGVARVLELNRKWLPDFVYTDFGNGSTNRELLLKRAIKARRNGSDPATARLIKTLKAYDSGSSIEVKDLLTNKKIKKPAKPFMISASVRALEQKKFDFPEEDTKLEAQFKNYIIERYSPNGTPVYGMNEEKVGDHRLDACNLTLVGFHLEFDDLYKISGSASIPYAVPDPRKHLQSFKNDENVSENNGKPSDRRVETKRVGLDLPLFAAAGNVNKSFINKTNRLGWAEDREEEYMSQREQRLASRGRYSNNRPQRSKF